MGSAHATDSDPAQGRELDAVTEHESHCGQTADADTNKKKHQEPPLGFVGASRMQGLVSRFSSLASGVMTLNVCCAPETHKDGQAPHYAWTNGETVLRSVPASGDADGALGRQGLPKSQRAGDLDNIKQSRTLLAGRYSGFLHRAAEILKTEEHHLKH